MTTPVSDFIDIRNEQQDSFSVSSTGAQSPALSNAGVYDVLCDVDCFIKVGPTANDVTTSTGYPIFAGNVVPVYVNANGKIGAITSGASGTLKYHKVAT